MKSALILLVMVVWCLVSPAIGVSASVRVAYPDIGPSAAFLWVAKDKGYFSKHGLDVEMVYITGGLLSLQALLGKNVDIIVVAGEIVIQNAARGGNVSIFGSFVNVMGYSLVASKGIRDVRSLKGKTIGINRFGSSSEYFTRFILEEAGLDSRKDVTLVQVGGSTARLAALSAGSIQGALLTPPRDQVAAKMGLSVLKLPKMEYLRNSLVATVEFLDRNPDVIKRFLGACRAATAWLMERKNKGEVIAVLKKYMRTEDDRALDYTYQFTVDAHQVDPRPSQKAIQNTLKLVRMMTPDLKDTDPARFLRMDLAEAISKDAPR